MPFVIRVIDPREERSCFQGSGIDAGASEKRRACIIFLHSYQNVKINGAPGSRKNFSTLPAK
jgi:hypothetical protein